MNWRRVATVGIPILFLICGIYLIFENQYSLYSNNDIVPISFRYSPSLVQISTGGENAGELITISPPNPENPQNKYGYNGIPGIVIGLLPCVEPVPVCPKNLVDDFNSNSIIATSTTIAGHIWVEGKMSDGITQDGIDYETLYQNTLIDIRDDAPNNPVITGVFNEILKTFTLGSTTLGQ